jgi:SAM-dependent methyltransferase
MLLVSYIRSIFSIVIKFNMNISTHTKISPANNMNADKNDPLHDELKGGEIIAQEIELITSLNPDAKTVLDIGCGTGRHVIPLAELGYEVTGIDLSEGMLDVLNKKLSSQPSALSSQPKIINADILTYDFNQHFDLIILMWNALNEIAMDEIALRLFFEKISKLMQGKSRVIINIDNLEYIDLENIDHKLVNVVDGFKYESDWEVEKLDKENNITNSRETISKFDLDEKLVDRTSEIMIQKWWKKEEIEKIASEFGISFEVRKIEGNKELYLVGSKQ